MQTIKKYLNLILLVLPLIISLGNTHVKHPFYLSVTELNIQTKEKLVQASCKIFTDDLQMGLHAMHHKPVNLEKYSKQNDSLLAVFVQQNLKIFIGHNPVLFKFIGYEIQEEAVWFYLEANAKNISSEIRVVNRFLCKSIAAQSNVIHCTFNETRKSYKLNCPETEYVFRF